LISGVAVPSSAAARLFRAAWIGLPLGVAVDVTGAGVDPGLAFIPDALGGDAKISGGFAEGTARDHLDQAQRCGAADEHGVHVGDRREVAVVPVLG
jgi:hypothetical protein